jgi:very-short-patch-repair endonuclease
MRSDATRAEERLWAQLRGGKLNGLKFRRQVPLGNAIVDFVCFERKLIVELDGVQHDANDYDRKRDEQLRARGFKMLRFWNNTLVDDMDSVLAAILIAADGGELAER